MNDSQLQKVVERISSEKPDIVVLDGDIVDESTTLNQMQSAFKILGGIDSQYGYITHTEIMTKIIIRQNRIIRWINLQIR